MSESPCRTSNRPRATLLSPFTARRIVDLPEPERPISTQISPGSIAKLTPAAPSTTLVAFNISSRLRPWSISASASFWRAPNTMSMFSKTTADISGVRLSLGTAADAIQNDRQQHDRKPGLDSHRNVDGAERTNDRRPQTRRAHQRGDDDHGEAQHDALRDPGHDGRQRERKLDLPEQLPFRRAERLAGFAQLQRNRNHAEIGQADRSRDRKDHGRDQARRGAEMKQHEGRDQIDESRQRLHQIEDRPQRRVEPRPVRASDAQRHADGDA